MLGLPKQLATLAIAAASLLLVALPGCARSWLPWRSDSGSDRNNKFHPVKASDLMPGQYCEIDMMVPPNSPDDSYQRFYGKVKRVTQEEVELADTVEESWIEYGSSVHRHPPNQQKRGDVHVPLTGVDEIVAPVVGQALQPDSHSDHKQNDRNSQAEKPDLL